MVTGIQSQEEKAGAQRQAVPGVLCRGQVSGHRVPSLSLRMGKEEREGPEVVEDIILQEVARMPYSKHIECKSWAQLELFRATHKRADGKVFKFAWSLHKAVQLGLAVPERYRSAAIRLLRQDEYRRLKFE